MNTNKTVVAISIDALHPDAIEMARPENILKVMSRGVFTLKGQSVAPPKTLINHTAMALGKPPAESGYTVNAWKPGMPRAEGESVFTLAKRAGIKTFYVYSKELLGFLATDDVSESYFAGMESIKEGCRIVAETNEDYFLFFHISGLEFAGMEHGWLSDEYIKKFQEIDSGLKDVINRLTEKTNTTLIITSDHSGHGKIHGSDHPEDFKMPLIVYSDMADFSEYSDAEYKTVELKNLIKKVI
jgi:predicted AlkP superfamily pyrophosphatase or phosphodiesterase